MPVTGMDPLLYPIERRFGRGGDICSITASACLSVLAPMPASQDRIATACSVGTERAPTLVTMQTHRLAHVAFRIFRSECVPRAFTTPIGNGAARYPETFPNQQVSDVVCTSELRVLMHQQKSPRALAPAA